MTVFSVRYLQFSPVDFGRYEKKYVGIIVKKYEFQGQCTIFKGFRKALFSGKKGLWVLCFHLDNVTLAQFMQAFYLISTTGKNGNFLYVTILYTNLRTTISHTNYMWLYGTKKTSTTHNPEFSVAVSPL